MLTGPLLEALIQFLPCSALAGYFLIRRRCAGLKWVGAFAALFFLDAFLLRLHDWAPELTIAGSQWNWSGKLLALLVTVAAAFALPPELKAQMRLFRELPPGPLRRVVVLSAITIGFAVCRTYAFGHGQKSDAEAWLFEATLPGVQEELSFRGVWWVLLLSAFQNPTNSDRFPRETLVVTTILFGSVHALHILPGGGISIDWMIFAATATSGLFYGLIQANGKSLWIPISVHTAANLAILAVQSVMIPFHTST